MLSIDKIVKVNVVIGSVAVTTTAYDAGLILGSSNVISASDRIKSYTSLDAVETAGFATTSGEYKAAKAYFSQNPAPIRVYIGRIDGTASPAETPVQALEACIAKTGDFYGVFVDGATDAQVVSVNTALVNHDRGMLFYTVSGTVVQATDDSATLATLKAADSRRALGIYTTDAYAAAAAMGRAAGLNHAMQDSSFTLAYKNLAGVTGSAITEDDADAIKAVNGNVYVVRGYDHGMLEMATTASGLRYDEVMYLDGIKADLQDAIFSLMAGNVQRLPQNDQTNALFINAISEVLEQYAARGVIASGIWRGESYETLNTGDMLDKGYYVYAPSYATQSTEDRLAHKGMPITVCLCLAGAVESVELTVYAQR